MTHNGNQLIVTHRIKTNDFCTKIVDDICHCGECCI